MKDKDYNKKEGYYIRLLSAHYIRIKSFIFTMLPNETDADDVMQETSVTLWDKFEDFQQGTDFVAWAVTIAKYKVMEFRRKNMRNLLLIDNEVLELLDQEDKTYFDKTKEKTRALTQCIKKLPDKDQNFLKLKYAEGFTLKKLAQRFGFSVSSMHRNSARIHGLLLVCIKRVMELSI